MRRVVGYTESGEKIYEELGGRVKPATWRSRRIAMQRTNAVINKTKNMSEDRCKNYLRRMDGKKTKRDRVVDKLLDN